VAFARAVGESVGSSQVLGDFQIWGLEFETSYRTDRTRFVASHSYSDLVDGHLNNPAGIVQGVSAYPYNDLFADDPFGRHLANWSPHLTKLYLVREFDCCWSASGSLRIYWDFPGARDLTEYNNYLLASTGAPSAGLGLSDPGYDKAFGGNYYLDLGLERKIRDRSAVRLDLYNVLGWFDQDLNKRNYLNRLSEYRAEAAAVALTARLEY
jgi:iron complex outermembrane receptor protein